MRTISRDDGFTLPELLVSSTIMLIILSGAMTTFKNALTLNDLASQMADSNQNLRAGANIMIKDLMQAGRMIGVAGVPIPSGIGAANINRPSPPTKAYTFDNVTSTTLPVIVTGFQLGPTIDNSTTDMITMIMVDPLMPFANLAAAAVAADGSNVTLGAASVWLTGDPANEVQPINVGDLVWFNSGAGAVQTVTRKDATTIYFDPGASDFFNFNQRGAAAGSVMALKVGAAFPAMKIYRLNMLTYYVDAVTVPGTPRFVRQMNHYTAQALAGVVEDLDITYDLVDGITNPANVTSLPYTLTGCAGCPLTYTSNQIRKVNIHMGVRSETWSQRLNNYTRNHVSSSVSVRDLASVNRYK